MPLFKLGPPSRRRAVVLLAAAGAFLAGSFVPDDAEAYKIRRIGRHCPKGQTLTEEITYRPCARASVKSNRPTFGGNMCPFRIMVCRTPYVVR